MLKTALITGAARGIGAAAARALHRDGFNVVINYCRSEDEAKSLAGELSSIAVKADISIPDEVRAMFGRIPPIDLLVNNAGIAGYGLFTDLDEDARRRIFAVNVDGAMNCCKCAIPYMVGKKSGNIINISSVWGIRGASCEAAYSASKSALIGFTLALSKELGPSGIRVNCVAPGAIKTDMLRNLSPEDLSALAEETPLRRLGVAEDVAELISFLSSDRASFITGQVIGADGGFGL